MTAPADELKCITPELILSFPHLDKPQPSQDGKPPKHGIAGVITKEQQALPLFKAMLAAARAAAIAKFGPVKGAALPLIGGKGCVFRNDIEGKGYPEGSVYFNPRSEQKPGLVYAHKDTTTGKPALVPDELIREVFYPGAIVRASVKAFGYENSGNKGVSFGLNNVQFLRDGARLDSRKRAEDEFEALDSAPADISSLV